MLRSANTALFNQACGASTLALASTLTVPMALAATLGGSALLERARPSRCLWIMAAASAAPFCLAAATAPAPAAAAAAAADMPCGPVLALYTVREAYVSTMGAHIWAHLNSWLHPGAAARLLGPVQGVAALGGMLGGIAASSVFAGFAAPQLCAAAAVLSLLASAAALHAGVGRLGEPARQDRGRGATSDCAAGSARAAAAAAGKQQQQQQQQQQLEQDVKPSLAQQFRALSRVADLRLVFGIVFAMQVASGNLAIALQQALSSPKAGSGGGPPATHAEMMAFNGRVNAMNNGLAATLQFTLAPFLLPRLSPGAVHCALAALNLAAGAVALAAPSLYAAAFAYSVFKSLNYSIATSSLEMCYMRLGFAEKFHGKAFINSFGHRAGKGATFFVLPLLGAVVPGFGGLAALQQHKTLSLGAVAVWFALSVALQVQQTKAATHIKV